MPWSILLKGDNIWNHVRIKDQRLSNEAFVLNYLLTFSSAHSLNSCDNYIDLLKGESITKFIICWILRGDGNQSSSLFGIMPLNSYTKEKCDDTLFLVVVDFLFYENKVIMRTNRLLVVVNFQDIN